jgi:hypothetical protein
VLRVPRWSARQTSASCANGTVGLIASWRRGARVERHGNDQAIVELVIAADRVAAVEVAIVERAGSEGLRDALVAAAAKAVEAGREQQHRKQTGDQHWDSGQVPGGSDQVDGTKILMKQRAP